MTAAELQQRLTKPYDRGGWLDTLHQLLPQTLIFGTPQAVPIENAHAESVLQLAKIPLAGGRHLAVLEIVVNDRLDLPRNRVGLRQVVARYIDQAEYHGVLAIFHQRNAKDYRFTFAARETSLNDSGQLIRTETAPRRYTYLLGPNESCRTAAERFDLLARRGERAELKDVIEAFNVEKLNKEFFAAFRKSFEIVVNDVLARNQGWERAEAERETQTLLSRLLFLYFIQRKGWLNRQRDYLVSAFNRYNAEDATGTSFNDKFLKHFFVKLSAEDAFFPQLDLGDLPFLNGGLFDDEIGSLTARGRIRIGNPVFRRVFDDLLEAYNFTVREDTPLDQEVAIDPEMLGKIFESLVLQLEQSDTGGKTSRHDTGSYYTPRPIVHYLCREGLRAWMEQFPPNKSKSDDWPARLEKLFAMDASDGIDDAERAQLNELLTPDEARTLLDRLDDFRACDPAVGSGAFLVGLLHELVNLRRLCESRSRGKDPASDNDWLYETKKRVIENVLYGVDIQERAVEICKLRLWISLKVDYPLEVDPDSCALPDFRRALKKITPLPNLDFKIRRADSLIEKIRGHAIKFPQAASDSRDFALSLHKLATAKHRFYEARLKKDKRLAQLDALDATAELAKYEFSAAKLKHGLLPADEDAERMIELAAAEAEMGKLQMQIAIARKRNERDKDDAIERLSRVFNDELKPTFVWQLDFAEIFHRNTENTPRTNLLLPEADAKNPTSNFHVSGFDLVLANPPFVDSETMTRDRPGVREAYVKIFRAAKGNWDLFVVFIERAIESLAKNGVISYIVPNKLIGAPYAESIRSILAENNIREIRDYSRVNVFTEAAVYPITFIAKKSADKNPVRMTVMKSLDLRDSENTIDVERFYKDRQWGQYFEKSTSLDFLRKCSGIPSLRTFLPAITGAATVSEAYEIKKCIKEQVGNPAEPFKKLVNTGTIDRYSILWGVRPTRYIKGSYERPIILDIDLFAINPRRLQQASSPKIMIGGMTLELECAFDVGQCLAGKSTTIILSDNILDLKYALGVLNSRLVTFWYQTSNKSQALAGGYLRINGTEIGSIPMPVPNQEQKADVARLVEYVIFLSENTQSDSSNFGSGRDDLMKNYFLQLIDALVYELFFPDELHRTGKHFFKHLAEENLPPLDEMKGDKTAKLRTIFERLFDRDHIIRKNCFFLDTLETIRITEGKA